MRAIALGSVLGAIIFFSPVRAAQPERFDFLVIGDVPFAAQRDFPRLENVISEVNRVHPAFTVHVGSIKGLDSLCSVDYYRVIRSYFRTFATPLVYTPGGNEWAECYRRECGQYDPRERLEVLRRNFFSLESSQGQKPMPLETQRQVARFERYVENARWRVRGVRFATVHVIGAGNNFRPDDPGAMEEFFERGDANSAWIRETFALATEERASGLVLFMNGNPFPEQPEEEIEEGYRALVDLVTEQTVRFRRPVLLVHGDSKHFRVDKPLRRQTDRRVIGNFTRAGTFGPPDGHALRVTIDSTDPELFGFRQVMVPDTRRTGVR